MEGFLLLGFLVGMAHAFGADHLAAIGSLASEGKATPKRLALLGASWGLGHTTTLALISLPVILFGIIISDRLAAGLEFAIGAMLILLGVQVFYKLRKARVHVHLHEHEDGQRHFHAHSHAGETKPHSKAPHAHAHTFSVRAYLIGLAHGAAGSAGLIALVAAATENIYSAFAYIALFGVGSILGMATLTYTASWPLGFAERAAGRMMNIVRLGMGGVTIAVGALVMWGAAPVMWGVV